MTETVNPYGDAVRRPSHYVVRGVPVQIDPGSPVAGLNDDISVTATVECHDIIDALGLHQDGDVQQAFAYLWRSHSKSENATQDIHKAAKCLLMSLRRRGVQV